MKVLLYLLVVICGVLGALSILRSVELLVAGKGLMPAQLLFGIVFIAIAWQCLTKARNRPPQ